MTDYAEIKRYMDRINGTPAEESRLGENSYDMLVTKSHVAIVYAQRLIQAIGAQDTPSIRAEYTPIGPGYTTMSLPLSPFTEQVDLLRHSTVLMELLLHPFFKPEQPGMNGSDKILERCRAEGLLTEEEVDVFQLLTDYLSQQFYQERWRSVFSSHRPIYRGEDLGLGLSFASFSFFIASQTSPAYGVHEAYGKDSLAQLTAKVLGLVTGHSFDLDGERIETRYTPSLKSRLDTLDRELTRPMTRPRNTELPHAERIRFLQDAHRGTEPPERGPGFMSYS